MFASPAKHENGIFYVTWYYFARGVIGNKEGREDEDPDRL
jgi:hypothetical protein